MSWVEKIDTGIIIVTGDGREYKPLYMNSPKSFDFNISEFEFPHVRGTLVDRRERKGRRYTLEFFFQGENHLEVAEQFEASSLDKRPWNISHPMHGAMLMQPASLIFDNTGINVSKITATLIETLGDVAPRTSIPVKEQTVKSVENFNDSSSTAFEGKLKGANSNDINNLTLEMLGIYDEAEPLISDNDQANEYFNLFNKANSLIVDLTQEPLLAIQAVNAVIMYPSLFLTTVQARINLMIAQFTSLSEGIENLITPNDKLIYENMAGNVIACMVNASVNPLSDDDYGNSVDVLLVVNQINETYELYLENLDGLQTDNGGDTDSYIPDWQSASDLSGLVAFATSNLYDIALDAKQERIIYLESDSNLIIQTHRFYGLQQNDSTIEEFKRNNKIGLSEILQLKKGRELRYYV